MRKTTLLIISLIFTLVFISSTFASINLEKRLYKETILSSNKIKAEYTNGRELIKRISNIFIKYRSDKDKVSVQKLQNTLKPKIVALNNKTNLTRNDRKLLNLYNNLYFRTVLLLDYQFKY
jgi:hypothetical protein